MLWLKLRGGGGRSMTNGAFYQIRVRGHISERWVHWFEEMTIGADAATTVLKGAVADQAALLGLLQKLYTLGMPLLSVRRVETGEAEGEDEMLTCTDAQARCGSATRDISSSRSVEMLRCAQHDIRRSDGGIEDEC
jgi:hypothetical protein